MSTRAKKGRGGVMTTNEFRREFYPAFAPLITSKSPKLRRYTKRVFEHVVRAYDAGGFGDVSAFLDDYQRLVIRGEQCKEH